MEAITANGLSKSFHGKFAVQDLDMHVPDGAIYGFIGKNGAGKSTTQKMICGLLIPTSGKISLWGRPVNDAEARSRMGVLIEEPGVFRGRTGRENLLLQAMNIGVENPGRAVDEALKAVGLGNTGKKKVRQFSVGMRQRLGIASALLGSPELLVLDEPINGLDPEGIREVRQTLLKLNKEYHVTILISSHILGELSKISTYYGIIRDGRMVKEISAKELSEECREYMRIRTANPDRVLRYLQKEIRMSSGELTDGEIHLFNVEDGAVVSQCMAEHGDIVSEISYHQMDLEEYFMNFMGGGKNE